jgi:hypothetical protein
VAESIPSGLEKKSQLNCAGTQTAQAACKASKPDKKNNKVFWTIFMRC